MRNKSYEKQANEMRESMQYNALLIEYIKKLRIKLNKRCNIYWMMNHDDENRNYIEEDYEIMNLFHWNLKKMLFIDNLYYYKYELSRDIYEDYKNESCSRFNFMKAFVLMRIQ